MGFRDLRLPGFQAEYFYSEPGTNLQEDQFCIYGCTKDGKHQWLSGTKYPSNDDLPLIIRGAWKHHVGRGATPCPKRHRFFKTLDLDEEFVFTDEDPIILFFRYLFIPLFFTPDSYRA